MLFFLSAIIPVTVAAIVSYSHVHDQLLDQSYEQSRQSSKTIGMDLYERLSLADNVLESIVRELKSSVADGKKPLTKTPQFIDIRVVADSDGAQAGRESTARSVVLNDGQKALLAEGKTVMVMDGSHGVPAVVRLITLLDQQDFGKGLLVGTIDPEYLWNVYDILSEGIGLAILDSSGTLLFRYGPFQVPALQPLKDRISESPSGYYRSAVAGEMDLVAYWTLFTDEIISTIDWTVLVSQTEADVVTSITRYRSIYIPLLVLVILVISFISVIQIRKRLAPVAILRDATQLIAGGDFSGRTSIAGDDELAQLGIAFNSMAEKLERQFKSISTLGEIDRLILSSFDVRQITSIVLERASDLTPCSVVAMIEFSEDRHYSGQLSRRQSSCEAEIIEKRLQFTRYDIHRLMTNPQQLLVTADDRFPAYLSSLDLDSLQGVLLLPMFIKQRLAAVIIFGYSNDYMIGDDELGLLRKFADHVTVALSNALWEERLYHQAHYDTLTDLPNRALLADRLEQAITRAQRNSSSVGLLFLDLDRFKIVNDTLGHTAGDKLLKEIGRLLKDAVRNIDTVVRFGGDEFIIIIPDIEQKEDVLFVLQNAAEKLLKAIQHKVTLDDYDHYSGASIGIAVYPKDGEKPDELIKNSDTAMYQAKDQGRGQYCFYSTELNAETLRRLHVERELRKAVEREELRLFYQAKVNAAGDTLIGAEALIRWQHPEKGLITPYEFIDIAEDTGLIEPIGEWVIRTACLQMRSWMDMGLPAIRVAVNVSSHQLVKDGFDGLVMESLEAAGLNVDALELEITESAVMTDAEKSIGILKRIHDKGIHIAIDDFGTGYSSLSYLRRLPISTIKIDQSFIMDIVDNQDLQAIVSSTINLAHQLRLEVIAEGIETSTQQTLLADWGCDMLQGYLFGAPLSADKFEQLLRQYANNRPSSSHISNTSAG